MNGFNQGRSEPHYYFTTVPIQTLPPYVKGIGLLNFDQLWESFASEVLVFIRGPARPASISPEVIIS